MECEEDSSGHAPLFFYSDLLTSEPESLQEQACNIIVDAHAEEKQARFAADRDENESAEVTQDSAIEEEDQEEEEEKAPLSYELQEGWKILDYFLRKVDSNLTFHFRDAVDSSFPDTQDYYEKVKEPVWLNLMREKFQKREYSSITEFITDFRRMVYNCCSFNGTTHHLSRKADKLLYMLTQKLNLLRHDIRQKTTEDVTTPWLEKQDNQDGLFGFGQRKRNSTYRRDVTSEMRRQLRQEEEEKAKLARKQKKEDKSAADIAAQQEMLDWEDEHLTVGPIKSIIRHSWELPQVGMFLHLCRDVLNLEEVPYFELERCLAMPRQSSRLQKIMTSILSTPFQRQRLDKMNMMPYKVWTEKLGKKLDVWFKTLTDCQGNTAQAAFKLGIEERFFQIVGLTNPLQEKSFHNLSFYRKVWILKSVCENLAESDNAFAKAIEDTDYPTDQRETVEGVDRHGNVYIYMPQFCGEFLRVYRHRKYTVPAVKEEEEEARPPKRGSAKKRLNLEGSSGKRSQCSTPVNDSEVESTASPAPSETRARSQASSSRHSSPMPSETNSQSRQASARNSPAPDTSSEDSLLKRGRRTRNSAESTFFSGNLDELLRVKSRRSGRAVRKAIKDELDNEMSGNMADERSQDATVINNSPSGGEKKESASGRKGALSVKAENAGEENSLSADCESSSGKDAKPDICRVKVEVDDTCCSPSNQPAGASGSEHIKTEPDSKTCDMESAIADSTHDKAVRTCDREVASFEEHGFVATTNSTSAPLSNSRSHNLNSSNQDWSFTCDTDSPSATSRTQSNIPTTLSNTDNSDSIKTEQTADDSGFLSFLNGSPKTEPGITPTAASKDSKAKDGDKPGNTSSAENDRENVASCSTEQGSTRVKRENEEGSLAPTEDHLDDTDKKPASSSGTSQNSQPSAFCSALLDHDFYTGEEMVPDPDEFELLVEDLEGLEALIKKFAPEEEDQTPQESPVDRPGKRQVKSRTPQKTPKRWACEEELYLNLCSLKNDMERHKAKAKFPRYRHKYHTKLRQEFQEFVEQEPKPHDADWDTESEGNTEDSTAEDSMSGAEESEDSRPPPTQAVAIVKGAASTTSSVESFDPEIRGIEEYELDVSSRGRLRKRRLIPNSDQPDKRKKIKKEEGVAVTTTANQTPNILQRSQGSTATATTTTTGSYLSLVRGIASNEQFVQQQLGPGQTMVLGPHGLQIVRCTPPQRSAATALGSASAQAKAFPVMQKILSGQTPAEGGLATQAALQRGKVNLVQTSLPPPASGQPGKVVTVALASTTSPTMTVSRATGALTTGGLSVRGGQFLMTAGGKQQVIQLKLQDELIKKGIVQYQVQGSKAQLTARTAATSATAKPSPHSQPAAARQILTPQGQAQGQPRQVLITATPRPAVPGAQGIVGVTPTGQLISPAKMQELLAVPASGHAVSSVKLPTGVGMGGKAPIILKNSGGQKTIVVVGSNPRKGESKYGNVTVKRLLEDRLANKPDEPEGSTGTPADTIQANTLRALQQAALVPSSCHGITSAASTPVGPTTLRLPSQSALDDALQSVVTGYHTTLPTADIKVPSPIDLPSLSPRKNVTRTVQSNKAPIFTTSKVHLQKKAITTMVSGAPTLTLDPSAGSSVGVAKPGTVVLPVRQGLANVDAAGKKQFVVQLISPGASGNVAQRIMLPPGAVLANLKTTQAGASVPDAASLQLLSGQAPSTVIVSSAQSANSALTAGGSGQLLGNPGVQGLLMTVPTSSSLAAHPPAGTSKITSEVLKSMLAAKVEGSHHSPAANTISTSTIGPVNTARVATLPGSAPHQLHGAQTQQVHSVIRASDIAGVHATSAHHHHGALAIQGNVAVLQQQAATIGDKMTSASVRAAVTGQPVAGHITVATPHSIPRQNIVRVSLPSTLQPGVAGIRLLAAGQPVSGGEGQPVLATVKPGAQGLQQLQVLASGPGLQGMRMQLLSQLQQQQRNLAAEGKGQILVGPTGSVVGSTGTTQSQHGAQVCYKVQPNRQVLLNSAMMPQGVVQGTEHKAATVKPRVALPAVVSQISSQHTPVAAGKIIMASQAAPIANLASLKLPQPPVNTQLSQACTSSPSQAGGANRLLSMSVTPSQLNNQFVSPVQSAGDSGQVVLRQVNNSQTVVASSPMGPAGGGGQLTHTVSPVQVSPQQMNHATPLVLAATPQKGSPKRNLSSTDLQPIPPKMARVDGTSGNSGAVLASLSQMVGSNMNHNSSQASSDTVVASAVRGTPGGVVQRVVSVSREGNITSSSAMHNFAAHIAQGNGMTVAAPRDTPTTTISAQGVPTQVNMAHILQQIAGVAPGSSAQSMGPLSLQIKPVQQPQQQGAGVLQQALQQVLYPVRQVGGQLLTTTNVPVTVTNGEVKVLPKATLQMGSQTVTVLSPSSAMIQNLRTPTSLPASAIRCQTSTAEPSSVALTAQAAANQQAKGLTGTSYVAAAAYQSDSVSLNNRSEAMYQESAEMCANMVISGGSSEARVAFPGTTSTPVLKARLEQPLNPSQVFSTQASTVDMASNAQGGKQSNVDHTVSLSSEMLNGQNFFAQQNIVRSSDTEVEEEAALNLLTLACQR
ncbi:streptococcal hemagglutinin-like [Littorina saxatilis]|uniref:streptococcal hemagglutinin-like n=1 Tax=Littorina saxatilis TaxID=31220 RepID=UPI0038B68C8C